MAVRIATKANNTGFSQRIGEVDSARLPLDFFVFAKLELHFLLGITAQSIEAKRLQFSRILQFNCHPLNFRDVQQTASCCFVNRLIRFDLDLQLIFFIFWNVLQVVLVKQQVELVRLLQNGPLGFQLADIDAVFEKLTDFLSRNLVDSHPQLINLQMDLKQIQLCIVELFLGVWSIRDGFGRQVKQFVLNDSSELLLFRKFFDIVLAVIDEEEKTLQQLFDDVILGEELDHHK